MITSEVAPGFWFPYDYNEAVHSYRLLDLNERKDKKK
jgi:hypothetical protein